jgi:hypothetical protein
MHVWVRAFTTYNAKLYPIQHVEGLRKRLKRSSHESHFQEDGSHPQLFYFIFIPYSRYISISLYPQLSASAPLHVMSSSAPFASAASLAGGESKGPTPARPVSAMLDSVRQLRRSVTQLWSSYGDLAAQKGQEGEPSAAKKVIGECGVEIERHWADMKALAPLVQQRVSVPVLDALYPRCSNEERVARVARLDLFTPPSVSSSSSSSSHSHSHSHSVVMEHKQAQEQQEEQEKEEETPTPVMAARAWVAALDAQLNTRFPGLAVGAPLTHTHALTHSPLRTLKGVQSRVLKGVCLQIMALDPCLSVTEYKVSPSSSSSSSLSSTTHFVHQSERKNNSRRSKLMDIDADDGAESTTTTRAAATMQMSCLCVSVQPVMRVFVLVEQQEGASAYTVTNIGVTGWSETVQEGDTIQSWPVSETAVMRKVSVAFNAVWAAISRGVPRSRVGTDVRVLRLVQWGLFYKNLFSARCLGCKRHLQYESDSSMYLPPTHRTLRDGLVFHAGCFDPLLDGLGG